jgi:hypothetical protein
MYALVRIPDSSRTLRHMRNVSFPDNTVFYGGWAVATAILRHLAFHYFSRRFNSAWAPVYSIKFGWQILIAFCKASIEFARVPRRRCHSPR